MQSTGYFATIYRFGVLISGPKNRVFDIKSGHDFCRYRNSIQVIYFQINVGWANMHVEQLFLRRLALVYAQEASSNITSKQHANKQGGG